ncbi:DUF7563 family protein [Halobaculum sp. P14]|uniref:DUF7563 family protein n=1 Tax=Halobaculum sp. P14 TaxID=3421638 RepID=UPI003EBAF048
MTARLDNEAGDTSCRNCGTHVSERFAAVFGDNNDQVHRCPACDSTPRLDRGTPAGKSVHIPDPEDQSVRLRGGRVRARDDEGDGK